MTSLRRARMLGAMLAIGMFALGVVTDWLLHPRRSEDTRVVITGTDAVPTDLERLSLSATQQDSVRRAIRRGRERVRRVVDDFDPRMRAALDTTNAEIRALLDSTQRAQFDSLRRANGSLLQRRVLRSDAVQESRAPE